MSNIERAAQKANEARRNIARVIHGQEEAVELLLIALATGGHALLEGVPGVGKTTLAKSFASATGLSFKRIQLTPDLMPSDVTGHTYLDQRTGSFKVREGPAFTNVLLADEINRAPPRTQSSLLEVMEERQVTIDGESRPVPDPFLVIATKNPIDIEGVYPLPEAQLDRFMLFIDMGYPPREVEQAMLLGKLAGRTSVPTTPDLVATLRAGFAETRIHPDVMGYILDLVRATREMPESVELGAGPRGGEHLLAAARAAALLEGRDYVLPDDVKRLAPSVLAHRILLTADAEIAGLSKGDLIAQILESTRTPVEVTNTP